MDFVPSYHPTAASVWWLAHKTEPAEIYGFEILSPALPAAQHHGGGSRDRKDRRGDDHHKIGEAVP